MSKNIRDFMPQILGFRALFKNIDEAEAAAILQCLKAQIRNFRRGETILLAGAPIPGFALILEGTVAIQEDDYYGRRHIIAKLQAGELFAEAFVFAGLERMPLSVVATEESCMLFIDGKRLLAPCPEHCTKQQEMLQNLLGMVARKNVGLTQKFSICSRPSTEEKLLAFLLHTARQEGSLHFALRYNRQELADYLGVERSAMCARLSALQKKGLIQYKGKDFRLLLPKKEAPLEA